MANTLTNLIPDAFATLDVVLRELVGFIPSVLRDSRADQVAANQSIRVPVTPANSAGGTITPAMSLPSLSDQTIANAALTITKQRFYPFSWSGEEQKSMDAGPGYVPLRNQQLAQAIRGLVNEMETDVANAIAAGSSRAYGTAGTTPFGTAADLTDAAEIKKILDDNGAPMGDRHLVLGTTASAKLRSKQSGLFKVNEAGTDAMLRRGELGNIFNFALHESGNVNNSTAGSGSGYLINNGAGYAIGDTALTVDTGSGTILAGDVITIGAHKYVVASALASNVVTIAAPGLRAAVADNAAVTVNATSVRNMAFSRNALLLATRLPAVPDGGDIALDRQVVTDPISGISFEFAMYPGFRANVYHVSACWGVKAIKPECAAVLLG